MTSTLNNHSLALLTLAESIGNTPLLPLKKLASGTTSQVLAKAEWLNPSGSVKVRAAAGIVAEAFADGRLKGRTLIDSTSGNTGIAYAFLGAALRFPVELVVPANVSPERKAMIRGYGATMTYSSPFDGSDGAIVLCREVVAKNPEKYFYADQYGNDANWRAHFDGTGPEIWRQSQGQITHFVAGLGTSGTFMGTGRYLRKMNPAIKLISVEPASPIHGLEGMKHMASAMVPPIYDPALADRAMEVETEDAYRMVLRLAREEAILAGFSSGAAIAASVQVARENSGACVVTVLPDGGIATFRLRSGRKSLLVISAEAAERIVLEAQRAYPHEGCGLLVGRRDGDDFVVTEAPTATNENSDRPKVWYDLSPDQQRRIEKEASSRGLAVLGFYHSHPDHPARPSEGDRSRAFGSYLYVIASVEKGKYKEMTAWALDDDMAFPEHDSKFVKIDIQQGRK